MADSKVAGTVSWILAMLFGFWLLSSQSHGSEIPGLVREHFSEGKFIKVELGSQRRAVKVFIKSQAEESNGDPVVLLHGMGTSSFLYRKVMPLLAQAGLYPVALDFPGSGFSDKFTMEEWRHERPGGIRWLVKRTRDVVREITEKGPFWRLEQLFETGELPEVGDDEVEAETVQWPVGGDSEELAEAVGQVLDSIGVDRVHLVAHDTSSEVARLWCLRHPSRVSSVTIIDSSPARPALPALLVGSPGLGSLLLSSTYLYSRLLKACCSSRVLPWEVAKAHAFLLRTGSGRAALLEMARMVNSTANLSSWAELTGDIPVQVLWSRDFSKEWKDEGELVADLLPAASLVFHRGSKWPQEDAAEEISTALHNFISSSKKRGNNVCVENEAKHQCNFH